jgi:hypothetical protein
MYLSVDMQPLKLHKFFDQLIHFLTVQYIFHQAKSVVDLDVYPGFEFFHPGSRIQCQKDSGSRIRFDIKEFNYLKPKNLFLSSRKYDPGIPGYPGSGS